MLRIVGIGEAILDIYSGTEKFPGGVPVNCVVHASQLGHQGILISRVGADAGGNEMCAELNRRGVDIQHVQTDPSAPTAQVMLQMDANGTPNFTNFQQSRAFHFLKNQPEWSQIDPDAIIFTVLGQLAPDAGAAIHQYLKTSSAFKLLDANIYSLSERTIEILKKSLTLADGLKLNNEELATVVKSIGITGPESVPALMQQFDLKLVLHTQGARGAEIFTRTQNYKIAALNPSPSDTNGCGDAFATAALILFLQDKPLAEIALAASKLAAVVANVRGAVPFYKLSDHEFDGFVYK